MPTENWKPIPGYEGLYEVSDLGRVKSLYKNRVLTDFPHRQGYRQVKLYKNGSPKTLKIHRLVLLAFTDGSPKGKSLVLHNDDNPENNCLTNLRWGNSSENQKDRVRNGIYTNGRREKKHCKRGHLLEKPNLRVSSLKRGVRNCRACDLAASQISNKQRLDKTLQELSDEKYKIIMDER